MSPIVISQHSGPVGACHYDAYAHKIPAIQVYQNAPRTGIVPFKKLLSKIMISRQSAPVDRDVAMLNSCEHFSKQKELR